MRFFSGTIYKHSGLIAAKPVEYTNMVSLDINSAYPFQMKKISIPSHLGEFRILNEMPESMEYGFYLVAVEAVSTSVWLTHYHLQCLQLIECVIPIIIGRKQLLYLPTLKS